MKPELASLTDFFLNGQAHGSMALKLHRSKWDVDQFRPYTVGKDIEGAQYVTKIVNGQPETKRIVANDATLTYDQWKWVDDTIVRVQMEELGAVDDLEMMGLTTQIPGGWGKTQVVTQTRSRSGAAYITMDPNVRHRRDRPVTTYRTIPIPVIASDWSFGIREIDESAQSGMPLDDSAIEEATRRVLELREDLYLGTYGTYTAGGGTLYGLTNYTGRITGSLTDPTSSGWTPDVLFREILGMRQQLVNRYYNGPYKIYVGMGWDQYFEDDYTASYKGGSLRQRIEAIKGVSGIRTLQRLPAMRILMVQMQKSVVRMLNAVPLTALRWESQGGLEVNGKVMWCGAPDIRSTYTSQTGYADYTV